MRGYPKKKAGHTGRTGGVQHGVTNNIFDREEDSSNELKKVGGQKAYEEGRSRYLPSYVLTLEDI